MPSFLFPSGLVAYQALAHLSLDLPVLPWNSVSCLYIPIFLLSTSLLHFVASQEYYGEGKFLSSRKTETAMSLSPNLIDSFSGQRILGCKGFNLCLLEALSSEFPELLLRQRFRDILDLMPSYATCFVSLEILRCFSVAPVLQFHCDTLVWLIYFTVTPVALSMWKLMSKVPGFF